MTVYTSSKHLLVLILTYPVRERLLYSLTLIVMKNCQAEHVSTGHRHPPRFRAIARWVYSFIRQEVRQQRQGWSPGQQTRAGKAEKAEATRPLPPPAWLALIRTVWTKSCVAFEGTDLMLPGLRASSICFVLLFLMLLSPACSSAQQS